MMRCFFFLSFYLSLLHQPLSIWSSALSNIFTILWSIKIRQWHPHEKWKRACIKYHYVCESSPATSKKKKKKEKETAGIAKMSLDHCCSSYEMSMKRTVGKTETDALTFRDLFSLSLSIISWHNCLPRASPVSYLMSSRPSHCHRKNTIWFPLSFKSSRIFFS